MGAEARLSLLQLGVALIQQPPADLYYFELNDLKTSLSLMKLVQRIWASRVTESHHAAAILDITLLLPVYLAATGTRTNSFPPLLAVRFGFQEVQTGIIRL